MAKVKSRVYYEWVVEIMEPLLVDIDDVLFFDELKEAISVMGDYDSKLTNLALIRDYGNDYDGVKDRGYAYVEGSKLPQYFSCGSKVPKRYHNMIKECLH